MKTFQYPGAKLALRHLADKPCYGIGFPEYRSGGYSEVLPMREVAMMMLMEVLTDKPKWHEKVFDETVVQKWREEARQQSEDALFARIMQGKESEKIPKPRSRIITDEAFDYCIGELRSKAKYFSKSGLIPTLDSPHKSIVKSDCYVGNAVHEELLKAFNTLCEEQKSKIDWHPGSNNMVQDLVHPSMYPFVFGRSLFIEDEVVGVFNALETTQPGKVLPQDRGPSSFSELKGDDRYRYGGGSGMLDPAFWSKTYQWLPANVTFQENGAAKFTSYVNNLHPKKFPEIYKALEHLIDKAIPAWDQCLSEYVDYGREESVGRTNRRFALFDASDSDETLWEPEFSIDEFKDADIHLTNDELYDLEEREERIYCEKPYIELDMEENERREAQGLPILTPNVTDEHLAKAKWEKYREASLPEPDDFETIDYTPRQSIKEKFKEHGLQIIVKMASIELTPEKPEFPAGSWHLEGQMNEKIAATALYYLDSENVTPTHLSFRMQTSFYFNDDIDAAQDEYNYLERVYGTSLGASGGITGACTQNYGDITTPQGRLLAFPNVFQHRVSSLRLQDPTKPGHRRFIALWLVDPYRRIISTANVPPQQKHWWEEQGGDSNAIKLEPTALDGHMTVDEAREHRLKLMEERTAKRDRDVWEQVQYNFCEH